MNPITEALEQCERWLQALDEERDQVTTLMAELRTLEHKPPMLFPARPHRNVKAVLPAVKRALRVQAG